MAPGAESWRLALGQHLMLERKQLKRSQADVAAQLDVSQRTVSKIERGETPMIDQYIKYSNALGLEFQVLATRAADLVKSRDA